MSSAAPTAVLDTKRGKQILMLLLAVAFLDFVDASIVNVALPSIRSDLGFTIRNLQWVLTGYLLTYGGLMLLGGRAADLFGRRRLLVAGTVLFAVSSLAAGLAPDDTVLIVRALSRRLPADEKVERRESLDVLGALLVTAGMLLLVYTIVEAPDVGWGDPQTIAGFGVAGVTLAIFAGYEAKHRNPVFPFSIFRVKGLAAADVTMVAAMAGFYTMFLFITLYLQNVLGLGPLPAGAAYVPAALGVAISAGISTNVMAKVGTRPVIVVGATLGAGGIFWLSRIPVDGSYWSNILPGLMVTALGLGGVLVGTTTAAQDGVSPDKAGLAAALINSSMWLGGALRVGVFSG